tara:strand:+ start:360 stop:506 length:147 start_codon:yes stop_codon:yes gene_type:complete
VADLGSASKVEFRFARTSVVVAPFDFPKVFNCRVCLKIAGTSKFFKYY